MTGLYYHRRKARLTVEELSERAGLCTATIRTLENVLTPGTPSSTVARLASALGVSMEELLRVYPDDALQDGDHPRFRPRGTPRYNLLEVYRREHNLTYQELATLLGQRTRQAAQRACVVSDPWPRHVALLAQREGLTVQEFEKRYQRKENVA